MPNIHERWLQPAIICYCFLGGTQWADPKLIGRSHFVGHVAILQGRCLICLTRRLTPCPMLGCSHWCHQTTSLTCEVLEQLKNLKAIQGGKYVEILNINEYHPRIIHSIKKNCQKSSWNLPGNRIKFENPATKGLNRLFLTGWKDGSASREENL